jgi:hypothetical protein
MFRLPDDLSLRVEVLGARAEDARQGQEPSRKLSGVPHRSGRMGDETFWCELRRTQNVSAIVGGVEGLSRTGFSLKIRPRSGGFAVLD